MTEFLAELTLRALVVAVAAGFVFGLALPGLFRALTERLIPDEQVDVLNAAAGYLVPFLAIPMGAAFLAGRAIYVHPGSAAGRFVLWCIFVVAVTIGDLLIQRLRGQGVTRVNERIQAIDAQTEASKDRRRQAIIDLQADAQRAAKR